MLSLGLHSNEGDNLNIFNKYTPKAMKIKKGTKIEHPALG